MRTWSKADDATIAYCAAAGLSASVCAKRLGEGVTRNMVIGRAYRLGVHFRPSRDYLSRINRRAIRSRWAARREALAS